MNDIVIFSFGLVVTICVASALITMIVAKNRANQAEDKANAMTSEGADSTLKRESRLNRGVPATE